VSTAPAADRRADFEQLFTTVYEPLQRFLRRRTDPATAEDVLGDVLLVLWRRIDDVPPDAPLAWAYGVARGCLANAVRGAGRQQRLVHRLADQPASDPDPDPDLDDALASLPEPDRELLHLWAWEQLPPREIAVVLGISANAASIRLHRATTKLRKALLARKDGPPPGHPGERQGKGAPR
jgi:RNA polymerase sigma-70 factor (ECF subfamily)